jgi:hypothetical protein
MARLLFLDLQFWLHAALKQTHSSDILSTIERMVGLLFAEHKNPAICTAQSFLMLQEHLTVFQKQQCRQIKKNVVFPSSYNGTPKIQRRDGR